jgi:hypothetical protein
MKKKILKNLLVLCFAFGGLFLIGNNVFGCNTGGPGSSSCAYEWSMSALGFTFSGGCQVECNSGYYACCTGEGCTCKPDVLEKPTM